MINGHNPDKPEYQTGTEAAIQSRQEARQALKELRRRRRRQPPAGRFLFWGLFLLLWAVLLFLLGNKWLTPDTLWKAFLIGLGFIFIIQSLTYSINRTYRSFAVGRLLTGIILLFVGMNFLLGINAWWPLVLVVAGVAVILVSWFLQREIEKRKFTQETLNESEVKYRHIIENANSVILEIDSAGNITFANKFALNFFGFQEPR